jgi:methylene-tetrahydromethanopterin dehydrogenase
METLELKPLSKKKLNVLVVEKEYNEPFHLTQEATSPLNPLFKPSIGFYKFLEAVVDKVKVDYATEELGLRSQKEFYEANTSAEAFKKANIPFFPVDIDPNAKDYIASALDKKVELRNGVLKTIDTLSKQATKDESMEKEYLIAYGQSLQSEIEEMEADVNFSVRESWIAMGIINHAGEIEGKEEITCLHISSPSHVAGLKKLLESLNVKVEVAKLSKKVITSSAEVPSAPELENWLQSIQVQVKPVMAKGGEALPHLLFYLDTDPKASPFDICMAYDAGYNAVIPYENVTAEDSKTIALDALLSRGPKGAKNTVFMIGGKNAEKAEKVLEAIKNAMFAPFKGNVIIDPAGAYTTAAAMVAKAENALLANKLGELKDKTCAIMGTGAVGQIAAVLLAKMGCNVTIASLNPKRTDGKEHIEGIAKLLAKEHGVQVQGVFAPTAAAKVEIIENADVIMCAGIRGVQIIDKEMLKDVKHMKVLVDINAVPPLGIEGIELKDDMREMMPGIFTIGALAVGELKHKLEKEILSEARTPAKSVFNFTVALPLARKLLEKDLLPSKLALTVSYQSKKN